MHLINNAEFRSINSVYEYNSLKFLFRHSSSIIFYIKNTKDDLLYKKSGYLCNMLKMEDFIPVGTLNKPHGVQGELNFSYQSGALLVVEEYSYLFIEHDGCIVPYQIMELDVINHEKGYVLLEDITSNEEAARLTGKDFYLPSEKINEDDISQFSNLIIGFKVNNQDNNYIGECIDYMDIPKNPLIKVSFNGSELLLPFHEELIINFSLENKTITLKIADGLL